jgi:hypothetical protein
MSLPRIKGFRAAATLPVLLLASAFVSRAQVHTTLDAPTTSVRLSREDAAPLAATFRQQDHALIGHVGFTSSCAEETRRVVHREMRQNRVEPGWALATAASVGLAVLGAYVISTADSADHEVVCGNGYDAPKAGDKCESAASSLTSAGASLVASGIILTGTSAIMLARSTYTEHRPLPDQRTIDVRQARPCGTPAAFEGLALAVLLPGFGGKWTGNVLTDGSARIDLGSNLKLPHGAPLDVFVETVPSQLAGLVAPGSVLARITLE